MTNKIAIVTDVQNAEFIVQALEEDGKLPEWVSEKDQEKFLTAVRNALSPAKKWECFNRVFDEIEAINYKTFEEFSDEDSAWFSNFEHNINKGPASFVINAVTNLYPEVSQEQLLYMIWPYMIAGQDNTVEAFWRHIYEGSLVAAHEKAVEIGKLLQAEMSKPGHQEARDMMFSLALITDACAYQDYCCLCLEKVTGQTASLISDFIEWGWDRHWIDTGADEIC
jgi:hypothetical protein